MYVLNHIINLFYIFKVLLPRIAYFSLYLSKTQLHFLSQFENIANFESNVGGSSDLTKSIWLQFNGEPLKWY